MGGAFETGVYPNLFKDYLGKSDEEIQAKIDTAWDQLFYGDDNFERVYYPVGEDMAYIEDIGNSDIDELRDPHASCVERLKDRPVPGPLEGARLRLGDQDLHFIQRKGIRNPLP